MYQGWDQTESVYTEHDNEVLDHAINNFAHPVWSLPVGTAQKYKNFTQYAISRRDLSVKIFSVNEWSLKQVTNTSSEENYYQARAD